MRRVLSLLLLTLLTGQDQEVRVNASLNRSTAVVGETLLLTVTLRAPSLRSPEIEDPRLTGLELLSSTDRSSFRYSPSLGAVREFSREYTLRALQAGEFTIPPVRISVDGALYETEALGLVVESEGTTLSLPGRLGPRPEEEVAVRLWLEPETAYVGQQVTLTVGAFFDPLVRNRLQRQPEYRPPELQGFWTADLPGSDRPERRVVGRREYFVQVYRRALFPLSPGTIRIPPAAVIYEVRRGLIYAPETFQVESAPATVVVRPLPSEGVPPDFAGAVGRYETEVWFDRSDLRAGEAVNLILEVRGTGNLSSLARPELPEIPGIRVYEGGEDAEVQLRGTEFAGHKRFSWVLVPEQAGQHVLPVLRLPYFDPLEATYRTARTDPVTLLVEPAPAAALSAGAPGGTAVRFVKARPGRQPLDLYRAPLFWLVQTVPVIILVGFLAFGRYQSRVPSLTRSRPQRRSRALRELKPLAESGDTAFFGGLRAAVLAWLGWRLHLPDLPTRGVVQVQHTLEDAGVPPPVALEVIAMLEECGRLRYAPDPPGAETAREMLSQAEGLLALVDKEAVSEKRLRRSPGSGALTLLAIGLVALSPAGAAAQRGALDGAVARWFQEGVSAYGRGEYAAAAVLFERVLEVRPNDPSLLYNLGNVYYELDDGGRAVAYWVRTLRIRPRDGDARFNLRLVVEDDPVIGSALPPVPLSRDELALLVMLFWLGGCGALIARQRWRKASLAFAGGAALTLAVLCAALMLYPRSEYAIIAAPDAALRAGPVRQSETLATPAPGIGYRVQEARGDWLRVSRGGESEGWVEKAQVELIR
ncbi:MAG: BatD family protein [Gemmatimonadota bacterium]|nr:MAG: BatD family protein [Gemmatimonadota bacterium]